VRAVDTSQAGPESLVIKRGEYGAMLVHQNRPSVSRRSARTSDDPTGAGDTFAAAYGLSRKRQFDERR